MDNNTKQYLNQALEGLNGLLGSVVSDMEKHLKTLTPEQQADFAKRANKMGAATSIKEAQEKLKEAVKDL